MSAEVILFIVVGAAALAGALSMVMARNPVYAAMGLLMTMFSIAVFYVMNNAHFVAAVQILIYAGAVMTLFLFVIMLIGVDTDQDTEEQLPFQRPAALLLGAGLLAVVLLAGRAAWVTGGRPDVVRSNGTIENISDQLFGNWLLAFESTILLLTIAAVGTIALAQFTPRARVLEAVESLTPERKTAESVTVEALTPDPASDGGDAS